MERLRRGNLSQSRDLLMGNLSSIPITMGHCALVRRPNV